MEEFEIRKKLTDPFPKGVISEVKIDGEEEPFKYADPIEYMRRLDDVLGIGNWQCKYPFPGCCELGIRIKGEWIWKSDCAGETDNFCKEGQATKAFRRACVRFGLGRHLYEGRKKEKNNNTQTQGYTSQNVSYQEAQNSFQKTQPRATLKTEPYGFKPAHQPRAICQERELPKIEFERPDNEQESSYQEQQIDSKDCKVYPLEPVLDKSGKPVETPKACMFYGNDGEELWISKSNITARYQDYWIIKKFVVAVENAKNEKQNKLILKN